MTSTCNKNTIGHYHQEQNQSSKLFQEITWQYGASGIQDKAHFAGDGLIGGRIPGTQLSSNYIDIESFLFGNGSTNLTNSSSSSSTFSDQTFTAKLLSHDIPSLHIYQKFPKENVIMPANIHILSNQRPGLFTSPSSSSSLSSLLTPSSSSFP
jgi:hypothetical protein